ncbi:MAG: glutamate--cysteine ligase [Candidatus Marinimicrobia bacterium]|nr:glutamate--cysteine ligase [Candidatus Neomarinimicrobiota bacterium]
MNKGRIYFNHSPKPTIGVEAELFTINKDSLDLCPGAPLVLNKFPESAHIKEELLECIVEVNTDICEDISAVRSDLTSRIFKVQQIAEQYNMALISMGTHPYARWKDQTLTQSNRYINFLERMQWPVRRLIISGLHVHIGVESGEKAIAITNGMTRYIPLLIGLSANSPYFGGGLTGLASTRTKIFEGLPTAGLPPFLKNYSEFQKFMRTLQKANSIQSIREVWWDIRPHPGFGTVEIRVCDAVPSVEEMVNLAALIQCLVVGLSNFYDDGAQLPILDPWVIQENKWRATRYGLDADIIVDEGGSLQSLKGAILETIDKIIPISENLGCRDELIHLGDIVENNKAPYQRQIMKYENNNEYSDIILSAINDLEKGMVAVL